MTNELKNNEFIVNSYNSHTDTFDVEDDGGTFTIPASEIQLSMLDFDAEDPSDVVGKTVTLDEQFVAELYGIG